MESHYEYNTLRDEVLKRFDKIHDTIKYGIILYISFYAYYLNPVAEINCLSAFVILQIIIFMIASYCYSQFLHIYRLGTHIKINLEDNKTGWYELSRGLHVWKIKKKDKYKWFYKLRYKWGLDSTALSKLIFILFIGSILVFSQSDNPYSDLIIRFEGNSLVKGLALFLIKNKAFVVAHILFLINIYYMLRLSILMQTKRENIEADWDEFSSEEKKKDK